MPIAFITILLEGQLKVNFTYLPISYFPGSLGFKLKHLVAGNDPSCTLMRLLCEVDQREGGIPTLSKLTYFPFRMLWGREGLSAPVRGISKNTMFPSVRSLRLLHGSSKITISYVRKGQFSNKTESPSVWKLVDSKCYTIVTSLLGLLISEKNWMPGLCCFH